MGIDRIEIASDHDQFLLRMAGPVEQISCWIVGKGSSPEFDRILLAHSVGCRDIDAVGDRMGPHHGFPSFVLAFSDAVFVLGQPADGRRV